MLIVNIFVLAVIGFAAFGLCLAGILDSIHAKNDNELAFWRESNRMFQLRYKSRSWRSFGNRLCWSLRQTHSWIGIMFHHRGDFLVSVKRQMILMITIFATMAVQALMLCYQDIVTGYSTAYLTMIIVYPLRSLFSRFMRRPIRAELQIRKGIPDIGNARQLLMIICLGEVPPPDADYEDEKYEAIEKNAAGELNEGGVTRHLNMGSDFAKRFVTESGVSSEEGCCGDAILPLDHPDLKNMSYSFWDVIVLCIMAFFILIFGGAVVYQSFTQPDCMKNYLVTVFLSFALDATLRFVIIVVIEMLFFAPSCLHREFIPTVNRKVKQFEEIEFHVRKEDGFEIADDLTVGSLAKNGPAHHSGVRLGWIIEEINDILVLSKWEAREIMSSALAENGICKVGMLNPTGLHEKNEKVLTFHSLSAGFEINESLRVTKISKNSDAHEYGVGKGWKVTQIEGIHVRDFSQACDIMHMVHRVQEIFTVQFRVQNAYTGRKLARYDDEEDEKSEDLNSPSATKYGKAVGKKTRRNRRESLTDILVEAQKARLSMVNLHANE
mmetsp:Transcript_36156/g.58021  ORF Transcript_36156/g.58021 Transcript_36156/m.58021 type:complete len:552 (+) Transcript_36156:131-1786(+)